MIQGIGHIGIVVADIEESLARLRKLVNFVIPPITEAPEKGMRCAVISLGNAQIELLQQLDPKGEMAVKQSERGDFIHHFALLTDDIESDLETYKSNGVEMEDQRVRIGLRKKKIAMSRPSAFNGFPVELTEP